MKTVLIYSGGLDSTVLLYQLKRDGDEVRCLGVDYGQRHIRELDRATALSQKVGVEFQLVDLKGCGIFFGASALCDPDIDIPLGHYSDSSMKATVVPNRNMVLLSLAIAYAISTKSERVAYGAHAGDGSIYPDCRADFINAMRRAAALCDWQKVELFAPYVELTKAQIVKRGDELAVPFEHTWSCYQGGTLHCGQCGTCVARREAFICAAVPDPTQYQVSEFGTSISG